MPSDFSAIIAKALNNLPESGDNPKSGNGKAAVKSNSNAKDDSAENEAAFAAAEPPPPPPNLPPPAPSGGHSHSPLPRVVENAGLGIAERRSQPVAPTGNSKSAELAESSARQAAAETPAKTAQAADPKAGSHQNGMAVAPSVERMKFVAEQNKIAGSAAQKLPPVTPIASAAAIKADAPSGKINLPVDFSAPTSAEQISLINSAKAAAATPSDSVAVAAVQAPTQANRVEQLISREIVNFKSSGAGEVGVSLKIDAHTQLFLQLSYREGQMQAVLRWEKGDLPALTAHFGQLQESLARQNIQLQSSQGGSDWSRQGSPGRQSQEQPPAPEARTNDEVKTASSNQPQPKARTVSRQGWETWA
jgi:hypothetical protein